MSATLKQTLAPLPATKRGSNVLVGGDPKGKNIIYTCGNSVIIRNLEDPADSDMYNEHTCEATVARYAPSGFYICSADAQGNIRIWDTTSKEHLLKYEYRPLSGAIKDLAWSDDSKRIVVAGDGREKFGAAILWDTGASVGEISGHSKTINSIDFKQTRPYRVATAGEDNESAFFHGPPFKYQFSNKDHTRFVQAVRFSPDGNLYATASSDGKIFIYDGKTGEKKSELGSGSAHKGSVMCVAWSSDSKQLLSVSADKTAKLWDVEANQCTTEFTFGDEVEEQQLGCVWIGDNMITLSLSGHLNYLDPANPSKPKRIIEGHNKPITALATSNDGSKIYSGDYSGRMVVWDVATGNGEEFRGKGHTNQINAIVLDGDNVVTAGMDDAVMSSSASGTEWSGSKNPTESCPVSVAVGGGLTAVACVSGIELYRGNSKAGFVKVDWDPLSIAVSGDGAHVAVGGKDSKLHMFEVSGDSLKETGTVDCKGQVFACAFSPDSSLIATGDSGRNVLVYSVPALELKMSGWVFHNARVNSLAWSPNGKYIVSGGLDTNILIWSMENRTKRITLKNAHVGSVTQVGWLNDTTIVSGGQDAAIKIWDVTHH